MLAIATVSIEAIVGKGTAGRLCPAFAERNVMECRRDDDRLFRLDVGGPDHLGPLLGFVGNQLSKLSR
jgi:hypothetical protein